MTIFISTPQIESICGAARTLFGCQTLDPNVWTFARCIAFICAELSPMCICRTLTCAFAAHGGDSQTAAFGVCLRAALAAGWFWLTGITGMDSCRSRCLSRQYFRDCFDILRGWGGAANPTTTSGNWLEDMTGEHLHICVSVWQKNHKKYRNKSLDTIWKQCPASEKKGSCMF